MKFFINTQSKKVVLAKDRDDARIKLGISHKQASNEINLYDPFTDKNAVIPPELASEVAIFKEYKFTHSLRY